MGGLANNQGQGLPGGIGNTGVGSSLLPMKGGSVLGSLLQLAGTAHLLRAASWELYGRFVIFLILDVSKI